MDTIQSIDNDHTESQHFNCTCEPFIRTVAVSSGDGMMDSDSSGSNSNLVDTPMDTIVDPSQVGSAQNELRPRANTKPREPFAIRFVPVLDHSNPTNVRCCKPIERRFGQDSTFRVGRVESHHSDFANVEPVIFRSKVVSRVHAEITVRDGKWFVRDIQSSSGTFLNNSRLSPANKLSPECALSNGDVLQFGINFRGGREEAFQCIKVRVELDYSWQHQVSEYNVQSLKKVRQEMSRFGDAALLECTICLTSVRPGQPLFISACTHGWHYRCIRPLLVRTYPQFQCPNCRAIFDLEEDDDEGDTDGLDENDSPVS